ncbi:hypothetical protein ColKHC_06475 [Colletotrichum higginsianum]|nr:hypothetical protein ColKHC_06475 [Colletotrichum higginsianum]
MTAHGVFRGHNALFGFVVVVVVSPSVVSVVAVSSSVSRRHVNSLTSPVIRCSAIKNTTVRLATNSGGAGGFPFLPVPVQTRTWSATSRCVGGIPANSGALSDDHRHAVAEPVLAEVRHLLAAAAVDERVALLQPQHRLALPRARQRQLVELLLRLVRVAGELARDPHGRAPRDEVQHARRHELVREDQVRRLDRLVRRARQEVRVSRPAAGEDDPPLLLLATGGGGETGDGRRSRCGLLGRRRRRRAGVRLQDGLDVVVVDGGKALQGPVLADLAQPPHAPVLGGVEVGVGDELVEGRGLVERVVDVGVVGLRRRAVLGLDAPAHVAQPRAGGAEVRRQRGGDLAADAGGELAAPPVGRDADLQRAVGVRRQQREGAQLRRVDDVDGDAVPAAQGRDVGGEGVAGPEVTKTASTTLSTSSRPRVKRSESSKAFLCHTTSPASTRFCRP